jgi:hypothetical protein
MAVLSELRSAAETVRPPGKIFCPDANFLIVAYIIFRKDTRPVRVEEAHSIFSRHGPIKKIDVLDYDAQTKLAVPPSLLVLFSRFDPKRDVIRVSSILDNFIHRRANIVQGHRYYYALRHHGFRSQDGSEAF